MPSSGWPGPAPEGAKGKAAGKRSGTQPEEKVKPEGRAQESPKSLWFSSRSLPPPMHVEQPLYSALLQPQQLQDLGQDGFRQDRLAASSPSPLIRCWAEGWVPQQGPSACRERASGQEELLYQCLPRSFYCSGAIWGGQDTTQLTEHHK